MPCQEVGDEELLRQAVGILLREGHVTERLNELATALGSAERSILMAEQRRLEKYQLHYLREVQRRGLHDKLAESLERARTCRSWAQRLSVTGGQLRFSRLGEEHTYRYSVEGVLVCGDEFLIGFKQHDYFNLDVKQPGSLGVTGGHIELRRGKPKLEVACAAPGRFVDLCQTLLAPLPGEESQGYIFLAIPEFDGHPLDKKIYVKDTDYPESFVEFAHLLDEPLVLVTHSNRYSFDSATELKGQFGNRWWPLGTQ
jgi:hypothetical protein